MLLENAGLACTAEPADIDERAMQTESGLVAPYELALHLAKAKALAVSAKKPGVYVVGADQTLALGDRLFNKPTGRDEAHRQLLALAGRTHALHSAIVVARSGEVAFSHVAVAWMSMRPLSETDISAYLDEAGAVVTTSVGAYQLEGLGVHLFVGDRGRSFHHPRPAAAAAAGLLQRCAAARNVTAGRADRREANESAWSDRLDRDGQIHDGEAVRRGRRSGLRRRCYGP
jgi:septum formation protein